MKFLVFSLLYLTIAFVSETSIINSELCFYALSFCFFINYSLLTLRFRKQPSLMMVYLFLFLFLLLEPLIFLNNDLGFPTWFELGTQSYFANYDYVITISIFLSMINGSYFLSSLFIEKINENNNREVKPLGQTSWFVIVVISIFLMIGFIPYISNGIDYFIYLLISGRSDGFSQFDVSAVGNTNFLTILSNFIIACGVCSGALLISNRDTRIKRCVLIFVLLLSIIIIASGGGRTRSGFIIVPLLFFYFKYKVKNIYSLSKFLAAVFLSLMIILSMVSLRDKGIDSGEVDFELTGFNLNRELYYILSQKEHFPISCDGYLSCIFKPPLETLEKFITNPIPRVIYPDKYLDPSFAFYNNLRLGNSGLYKGSNITPTVIGRYYMLYGFFGVFFVGGVFGVFSSVVDRKLQSEGDFKNTLLLATLMYYIAQSVRDLNPGWLYPSIFTFILAYFISKVNNDSYNRS